MDTVCLERQRRRVVPDPQRIKEWCRLFCDAWRNATLGKISGNLKQIANRMNATGNVYKADVEEVKKLIKQVWDTQKAMLAKQPSMKQ